MSEYDARTGASSEAASQGGLERGIIVEELRLVYVPVSKAACTSLRWLISDLARLPPGSFEDPKKFRATQGQTIQNIDKWPPQYIVQNADPAWLEEVAEADDWFRFSVVRDPARRLWSAWQSKLLLRLPGFERVFGEERWFPDIPSSPEEVLESYEQFVAALGQEDEDRRPKDPHWRPQTKLLGKATPVLDHVGRTEAMGETLGLLGEHVARFGKDLPPMRRENLSPLPYPEGLLGEETVRIIREYYADDYRAFGYAEPEAATASEEQAREWWGRTNTLLDATQIVIARNERLATLDRSLQEARRQAAKARRNSQNLRQEQASRDRQVSRLRARVADLKRELRAARGSLREIQESGTWRYTAPLRRLISNVKRLKAGQGDSEPG